MNLKVEQSDFVVTEVGGCIPYLFYVLIMNVEVKGC